MTPQDKFDHQIINVPIQMVNSVDLRLQENQDLIERAENGEFSAKHMAFIKSFSSIIDELDPLGGDWSDSIRSDWYNARYYYGNSPKSKYEESIVFGQYLAVVRSILNAKV